MQKKKNPTTTENNYSNAGMCRKKGLIVQRVLYINKLENFWGIKQQTHENTIQVNQRSLLMHWNKCLLRMAGLSLSKRAQLVECIPVEEHGIFFMLSIYSVIGSVLVI